MVNQYGHSHWAWKLAKLGWKLPSNYTKFHPKLCTKNHKSECDFSNFARNFARWFVMRTHTAEKSRIYSHDFRIRSSFSAWQLNVRAAVSEFYIQYSCTYLLYICICTGKGWTSKLDMRSSSRNFTIFSSELTSRVFEVMRPCSVKHFHVTIFWNENSPHIDLYWAKRYWIMSKRCLG